MRTTPGSETRSGRRDHVGSRLSRLSGNAAAARSIERTDVVAESTAYEQLRGLSTARCLPSRRARFDPCGERQNAVHQPGNTLCVHSPPLQRDDSPALSSTPSFPEPTATDPLVAVSDATTSSLLVVRPLLVSVEQAAGLLGIGRTTLYELIRRGDVRPIRIGRCVRIPRRELEAFVERLIADADASV
jgi:excisionase family DNA binding protein